MQIDLLISNIENHLKEVNNGNRIIPSYEHAITQSCS